MMFPHMAHDKLRAGREPHFPDRYDVMLGRALPVRVSCKAVLRLRDAHGEMAIALILQLSKAIADFLITDNVVSTVHLTGNRLGFFPKRYVVRIKRLELRRLGFNRLHHRLRQLDRAFTASGPVICSDAFNLDVIAQGFQQRILACGIGRKSIDRDDNGHTEFANVFDMPCQIVEPFFECREVFLLQHVFIHAAMHLESTNGSHNDGAVRLQPSLPAFDVHEFFGAEIRAEAGFSNDIIRKLQGTLCG